MGNYFGDSSMLRENYQWGHFLFNLPKGRWRNILEQLFWQILLPYQNHTEIQGLQKLIPGSWSRPSLCLSVSFLHVTQSHPWQSHPSWFSFLQSFLALTVRMFRIFLSFRLRFAVFPVFCSIPRVDPHVPHILWIEYEENWDDWLCQGATHVCCAWTCSTSAKR